MNIEKRDFFTAKMAQELRNQEPPTTTTTFKKSVLICCELNSTGGVILEKQIIKKTNEYSMF